MRRCVERKPSHRSISERRISRTLRASALGQFASPDQLSPRLGGRAAQLELPRTATYASGCRPARAWRFEPRAQPEARAELVWLATCPSASAQTDSVPGAAQRILGRMPVLLAAAGFLLVGLDGSLNIAFPAMAAAFDVGLTTIRWVIICYVGTYSLTAFAAGVLADRLGAGRVVRAGLFLSLLCFLAFAIVPSFATFAQFSVWLLAPFYLVTERGLSAAVGGLLFMLTPLATAAAAPLSGRATDRWGRRGPVILGLAVEAAGLVMVARCGAATPLALVGAALALVGLGLGVFQVPNIAQTMAAFPARQQGTAGGFAFLSRTLGVVSGVQSAAWLFGARAAALGFLPAFRFTFDTAAVVCAVAALLALLPARERAARRAGLDA